MKEPERLNSTYCWVGAAAGEQVEVLDFVRRRAVDFRNATARLGAHARQLMEGLVMCRLGKETHALAAASIAALALLLHCNAGRAQPGGLDPAMVETVCTTCHGDKFEALTSNPHTVLDSPEWRERTGQGPACVSCHGDVSAHVRAGGSTGVITFRAEPTAERNAVCLGCHAATHPEFESSGHATAGLACTDCHSEHGAANPGRALLRSASGTTAAFERIGASSALCADCHADILSLFAFNERHRIREGTLECTSCHDPHAPAARSLLGGFRHEQCIDCHADKGGPFVFEHGASRVEGCTACHSPHGSPNRHLLAYQQTGALCLGCHAAIPQFHLGSVPSGPPRFGMDTQCTNCHSSIHGSNVSPFFLQ